MRLIGSFANVKFTRGFDFYLHPPFRSRRFLSSFISLSLPCLYSALIVLKNWRFLSATVVSCIAISMLSVIFLLRIVLLATQQVDPMDKESPLGVFLKLTADALPLSYWGTAQAGTVRPTTKISLAKRAQKFNAPPRLTCGCQLSLS